MSAPWIIDLGLASSTAEWMALGLAGDAGDAGGPPVVSASSRVVRGRAVSAIRPPAAMSTMSGSAAHSDVIAPRAICGTMTSRSAP